MEKIKHILAPKTARHAMSAGFAIIFCAFDAMAQTTLLSENFESQTLCGNAAFACVANASCALTNGWTNAGGDNIDWSVDENGTPSGSTGPNVDHTLGTTAGNYLFTEASSCFNQTGFLLSPSINISGYTNVTLEFWYHMFGTGMGNLYIEVYDGVSYTPVDSIKGQQQTVQTDAYLKRTISLSAFTGNIQMRFRGVTGADFASDMAIDDVVITGLPPDAGILSFISPQSNCGMKATENVTVQIKNYDTASVSNFNVSYRINGGAPVTETYTGTIAGGASANYTFIAKANLSAAGNYIFDTWTSVANDLTPANDSTTNDTVINSGPCPCFFAKQMAGIGGDNGQSIAVDGNGNVYTTGYFNDTADFDPGAGTFNLTSAGSSYDIFVSKLDASGNFLWAKAMGGTSSDLGYSIAVDGSGNVYTTGYFTGTADFDPGAGTFNLISAGGGNDIFVSKLDAFGNFVWAKQMGGTSNDYSYSIAVNSSGNVYTTGSFAGTADFDPGAGIFNLASAGLDDIFVSKLDASGNFVWAKNMGGTISENAKSIAVDSSGNVYTAGYFAGTADFDPGAGTFNLISAGGGYDIFVSKLDATGNFLWAKAMGGTSSDFGYSIAVDSSGNVYTTGYFTGTADFDPGAGTFNLTSAETSEDIFVSKLDASGNFLWAKQMGGINSDFGNSIVVDGSGIVYTTGYFNGTADFDPDSSGNFNLTSAGGYNIFVSKLDASGNFIWAKQMGGTSNDIGNSIVVDGSGNVFTTGSFNVTADFDPGAGTFNLTSASAGTADVFVSKIPSLAFNVASSPSLLNCFGDSNGTGTVTIADGKPPYTYIWNNGQITQAATGLDTGIYYVTVTDSLECYTAGVTTISQPPQLVFPICTITNVLCNGGNSGSIYVTSSGGTGVLQYSKDSGTTYQSSNIFSNLAIGDYYIRVKDANGCITAINTVTVTEPTLLTASITKTNVACYGGGNGSATATPSGGTSPYNYNWSNGQATQTINNLFPGTYTINVFDLNGCATNSVITISQPALLAVSISATNNTCNGGSTGTAAAAATGGSTPYTYSWSGGGTTATKSNLVAGTFYITITDSCGITKTDSVVITQPSALSSSITKTDVNCFGNNNGSATANPVGGTSPFTYLWNTGATSASLSGLQPVTSYVTITDACAKTKTDSVTIAEPLLLVANNISKTNVSCFGGGNGTATVNPAGGTTPYTYNWSNGQTGQTAIGLFPGTFGINVFDAKGCLASNSVVITQPLLLAISISAMHNACNGALAGSATVAPTGGTSPYSYLWSTGAATQNISSLPAGTYYVTVTDSCSATVTQTVQITQPGALSLSKIVSNVKCNGQNNGSASLTISGGVMPYNYNWSNGATTASLSGLAPASYYVTVTDSCGQAKSDSAVVGQPATLSNSVSVSNVSCYGSGNGSATLTASGGTSPYTYLWSNNQTTQTAAGLFPGTYSVNVVDVNSCVATGLATITQPAQLSATTSVSYVSCNGASTGSATVAVAGGSSPYGYLWSNGAQTQSIASLQAGTYSVTVTDSCGASITKTEQITQPGALSISKMVSDVKCNGANNGSASLTVSGGVMPYTYNWSNGATSASLSGLAPASYYVTVTDSCGQAKSDSVVVAQPATLSTTVSTTNVSCYGLGNGTAAAAATGGTSPYTYLWSNSQSAPTAVGLIPGTYTVNVVDANSCIATGVAVITQPAPLSATVSVTNVNCYNGSNGAIDATVSGSTTPYSYSWSNGSSQSAIGSLQSGNYTVTITDSCGFALIKTATITQPGALSLSKIVSDVKCNSSNNGSVSLTASGGVTPYSYIWSNGSTTNNIANLAPGTYTVTVADSCGSSAIDSTIINQPALLTTTVSGNNVTCFGLGNGSAAATVAGGSTPYSFQWNNGQNSATAIGLFAGNYAVNVFDFNGCLASNVITISQPPALNVSVTAVKATCGSSDGTAAAAVAGGSSPYSYLWSNGNTNSAAAAVGSGSYAVTVTDSNSCTKSANASVGITVVVHPICIVTVDSTSTRNLVVWEKPNVANIDSFRVYREYSTGFYKYLSSVDFNSLSVFADSTAGVNPNITSYRYKIAVVDTCGNVGELSDFHKTVHLTTNVGLNGVVNLIWDNYEGFSFGKYRVLRDSGGTGNYVVIDSVTSNNYTYTDLTPPAGKKIYMIEIVHPSGCTASKSAENHNTTRSNKTIMISAPQPLNASTTTTSSGSGSCTGTATVSAFGGASPYTYLWDGNAGAQTTATATGLCPGIFGVSVTDAILTSTTVYANVGVLPGVGEYAAGSGSLQLEIVPNPNNGSFILKMERQVAEGIKTISLQNVVGQVVWQYWNAEVGSGSGNSITAPIQVELPPKSSGVYFLRVGTETSVITKKVVVR